MIIAIALFILVIAADQVTKLLLYGKELSLLPGVIGISSPGGLNTGMAWGLLGGKAGSVVFLSVMTALTLGILVYLIVKYRSRMPRVILFALALIAGGAVGNLIDRIVLGGVRDFIRTQFMDFPYFNVADIAVTVGGFLLAFALLFTAKGRAFASELFADDKKKKAEEKPEETTDETPAGDKQQ